MNYIQQINNFYDRLETNPLSGNAINLWHALMATANKAGWINKYAVAISILEVKTSLNKKAIERARNELAIRGYIVWNKRGGNQSAEYTLIDLCDKNNIEYVAQSVPQPVPQPVAQSVSQPVAISKLNKAKQDNNTPISPKYRKTEEEKKVKYADFVSMTDSEHISLIEKVGESGAKRCVEILDNPLS